MIQVSNKDDKSVYLSSSGGSASKADGFSDFSPTLDVDKHCFPVPSTFPLSTSAVKFSLVPEEERCIPVGPNDISPRTEFSADDAVCSRDVEEAGWQMESLVARSSKRPVT